MIHSVEKYIEFKIQEAQHGKINKEIVPEDMRGRLAKKLWDTDESFSLGMEYGVILALLELKSNL